jgi:hypothetical protein
MVCSLHYFLIFLADNRQTAKKLKRPNREQGEAPEKVLDMGLFLG